MKYIILTAYILYLPFKLVIPQLPISNWMDMFFLSMLLIYFHADKKKDLPKPGFELFMIIFVIFWAISVFTTMFTSARVREIEAIRQFKHLITLPLGYLVFSRCLTSKKQIRYFYYIFMLSIVLVSIHTYSLGIIQGSRFRWEMRSSGPFGESWFGSDIAGGFIAQFLPFLFCYMLFARKHILKIIGALGFAVSFMGLLATYSRGALLAFIISVSLVTLLSFKHMFRRSRVLALIILIGTLSSAILWESWLPPAMRERIETTTVVTDSYYGTTALESSAAERFVKWDRALNLFYEKPVLGHGFVTMVSLMYSDPHNTLLQIAAEMGFVAALAFIIFIIKMYLEAWRLRNTEFDDLSFGFIGFLISFIIVNQFYSNFFRPTVIGSFWVVLGIVSACRFNLAKVSVDKQPVLNRDEQKSAYDKVFD